MNGASLLPVDRFLQTMAIVSREGGHLVYSWRRLYAEPIDPAWVRSLDAHPELAERLGVVESVERWLEARKLRNRLVHEYMSAPEAFANDLILARDYVAMLIDTFNRVREFALTRMQVPDSALPKPLALASAA